MPRLMQKEQLNTIQTLRKYADGLTGVIFPLTADRIAYALFSAFWEQIFSFKSLCHFIFLMT